MLYRGFLSRNLKWALLLLITILAFQSAINVYAKSLWRSHVIDPRGKSGSIALDSQDNPHISFYSGSALKYASRTGTNWTIQTVDPAGSSGPLVLDSHDRPHISYSVTGTLIYASWDGSKWDMQTVDQDGAEYVSLALDSNDKPHLSYLKDGALKYAELNNSVWSIQTVDSQGQIVDRTYIALDKNDSVQIIYTENLGDYSYNIKYASRTGAEWHIQTAFSRISVLGNMVLDSHGRPHLLYVSSGRFSLEGTLIHAYWTGSTWNTQNVSSKADTSYVHLLALDSHDRPHIIFCIRDKGLPVVMYATLIGSNWDFQVASDLTWQFGWPLRVSSMVMDSQNRLHLATDHAIGTERQAPVTGDLSYATFETTQVSTPNSFPTTIIAVVIGVVVIGTVLLVYFRKRRHN